MIKKYQHETDLQSQMIEKINMKKRCLITNDRKKSTWNWSLITNDRKNQHENDL
jgi:hypothetical protein